MIQTLISLKHIVFKIAMKPIAVPCLQDLIVQINEGMCLEDLCNLQYSINFQPLVKSILSQWASLKIICGSLGTPKAVTIKYNKRLAYYKIILMSVKIIPFDCCFELQISSVHVLQDQLWATCLEECIPFPPTSHSETHVFYSYAVNIQYGFVTS